MGAFLIGTNIFVSKNKAYKYYKFYNLTYGDIERLAKNEEIGIGVEYLKKKYPDYDYMVDSDGRYFLKVKNNEENDIHMIVNKEDL